MRCRIPNDVIDHPKSDEFAKFAKFAKFAEGEVDAAKAPAEGV